MATDFRTDSEPSMTRLVSGIVSDVQDLLTQQLALFRHEVEGDFKRSKQAALPLLLGVGIGLMGVALLGFMLVYLLNWATELPLWGCFGLVGGGLAGVGVALYQAGLKQFGTFNPLPDESAQALKENIQCLMKPK